MFSWSERNLRERQRFEARNLLRDGQARPAVGLCEFRYKFGWLQGTGNSFTGKNN